MSDFSSKQPFLLSPILSPNPKPTAIRNIENSK